MCNYNRAFYGYQGKEGAWGHRGEHLKKFAQGHFARHFNKVPVNVIETDTAYELSVIAPGRDKTKFSVKVKDKVLTISYNAPESETTHQTHWTNQEYAPVSFERSFLLNNKIDETAITAQYTEGVLKVILLKTAEAQQPPQDIQVG